MRLFFWSVISCILWTYVHGIFEEQLNEYNWKHPTLGLIQKSVLHEQKLLAFTSAHNLISLNSLSGQINWKISLSRESVIEKLLVAEDAVITLSRNERGDDEMGTGLVRSWSITNGRLNWEIPVGGVKSNEKSVFTADILFDAKSKQITVLFGNSLHYISAINYVPQVWSAPAVDMEVGDAKSQGSSLVLTSLIVPTTFGDETPLKAFTWNRVAIGCMIKNDDVTASCNEAVVVKLNKAKQSHAIDVFPGLPTVSVNAVKGVVSSEDQYGYLSNDALFGVSADSLHLLSLHSKKVSSFSFASMLPNNANGEQQQQQDFLSTIDITQIESFVYATIDEDIRPAVSLCWREKASSAANTIIESNGATAAQCVTHTVQIPESSAAGYTLQSLVSHGGSCKGSNYAFVSLESELFDESIITSVHCVAADTTGHEQLSLRNLAIHSSEITTSTLRSVSVKDFLLDQPVHAAAAAGSHAASSPFAHVHITRPKQKSTKHHSSSSGGHSKAAEESYLALLVFPNGYTTMLHLIPAASTSDKKDASVNLLWRRDESLSRVQQALLIDVEKQKATTSAAAAAGGETATVTIPTFSERIQMQKEELAAYANEILHSSKHLKAQIKQLFDAIQRLVDSVSGKKGKPAPVASAPRNIPKMRLFGFDKVAVCLSYSTELASVLANDGKASTVSFQAANLQITALDLLRDAEFHKMQYNTAQDEPILWTAIPVLPPGFPAAEMPVSFVRIVSNPVSSAPGAAVKSITFVVGMVSGDTCTWDIDPHTGKSLGASITPVVSSGDKSAHGWIRSLNHHIQLVTPTAIFRAHGVIAVISAPAEHIGRRFALLQRNERDGSLDVTLIDKPANADTAPAVTISDAYFTHVVDKNSGKVSIYKVTSQRCSNYEVMTAGAASKLRYSCFNTESIASLGFAADTEQIVDVTYPNPLDIATVHSRSAILGDDSVLLKYLNPNIVVVSTVSPPAAATADYYNPGVAASTGPSDPGVAVDVDGSSATGASASGAGAAVAAGTTLTMNIIDTITGKIIKRIVYESGAAPVHAVVVENTLIASYWNTKAKRTELTSTALYEGVIGRYDLGPFGSSASRSSSYYNQNYSSYTSILPTALQKSYVLPKAVVGMHQTVSANGITNKHILMALRNGQIYHVDLRQIHPRRPMGDPSPSEKEEGLSKYNPFLMLAPLQALTYNETLSGYGATPRGVRMVTAPTRLESSSLLFAYGDGVDLYVNRVMPSQGFDLLASDFQYGLLVLILFALAVAVGVLRRMFHRKKLNSVWP